MDSANSLVTRVIQDSSSTLSHHARSLRDLGVYLGGVRAEFVGAWRLNIEREPSLARLGGAGDLAQEGTTSLVDPLGQQEPETFLNGTVRWSHVWRARGASFADSLCFMGTLRRTFVPFLLRAYVAGPELELVFGALDALERAVTNVLGAAEIQETQTRLTYGAQQRTVGRLAGGVAHAVNNTLAVIVGRSQILEQALNDEGQRGELREIHRMALAGADALKRLQLFAIGQEGAEPSRMDVNAIVSDVVQLTRFRWREEAEASGINIEVAKELGVVPPVIGHGSTLSALLVELLLNSVEAMPMGGLVTIRTMLVDDRIEITVHDRGQGMEDAARARGADPLSMTGGPGHVGPGMTGVQNLAQQMGGVLSFASVPGHGTTATLALPAAPKIQEKIE